MLNVERFCWRISALASSQKPKRGTYKYSQQNTSVTLCAGVHSATSHRHFTEFQKLFVSRCQLAAPFLAPTIQMYNRNYFCTIFMLRLQYGTVQLNWFTGYVKSFLILLFMHPYVSPRHQVRARPSYRCVRFSAGTDIQPPRRLCNLFHPPVQ
jgi:hypothetical protein